MKNKGQSTLEVSVLIAAIACAVVAMHFYIKRGVQGKIRQASDSISDQQYDYSAISSDTTLISHTTTDVKQELKDVTGEAGGQLSTPDGTPLTGIESSYKVSDYSETTGYESIGGGAGGAGGGGGSYTYPGSEAAGSQVFTGGSGTAGIDHVGLVVTGDGAAVFSYQLDGKTYSMSYQYPGFTASDVKSVYVDGSSHYIVEFTDNGSLKATLNPSGGF
ncbi:MAG: hypothetical protein ACM3OC_09810 [Deltaproteobacteria bacterium]